jgi:hypothetical protein
MVVKPSTPWDGLKEQNAVQRLMHMICMAGWRLIGSAAQMMAKNT